MKFNTKIPEPIGFQLAPMLDVVFLLLIFFMVSTTFTRETQLKVDLPESASGEHAESNQQHIELLISAAGEVAINGKTLIRPDLETLKAALARESSGDNSLPVVITADANTPHQTVITAMDAAGQQGFTRLRLTTNEMQRPAP